MRRPSVATVLVGPDVLIREGLTRILAPAGFRVVASVSHLNDLVWPLLSPNDPVLLILNGGDRPDDDAAQIRAFKKRNASARIAVLSGANRPADALAAFQAGANVYLGKLASCSTFTKTVELVMLGETILPAELLQLIGAAADDAGGAAERADKPAAGQPVIANRLDGAARLSARERWILCCIVDGDSNKHIARKIGIAEATVKVHVKAILRKIQLRNRTQAAIWAVNNKTWLSRVDGAPPLQASLEVQSLASMPTSAERVESTELAAVADGDR